MIINTTEEWLKQDVFDVIHLFIQSSQYDENPPIVNFETKQKDREIFVKFKIDFGEGDFGCYEENLTIEPYKNDIEYKRYVKRVIKKSLYKYLSNKLQKTQPWGCLTGIRPTKMAYEYLEKGGDKYFIKEELMNEYFVTEEKAKLVEKTIRNQNSIIKNDKLIDIYVNIPFCPTKCSYCSFISHEYCKVQHLVKDYIDCLVKEIRAVKKLIRDKFYIVRTIYIGGGTPSVLSAEDLETILSELYFGVTEFTVECGRPDTITKEKLDVLKKYGVTRISINPQSFVDSTLKRVGRKHTSKDIIEAYKLALPYNFQINMDLIAGLPGETLRGFKKSVQMAVELYPNNITIHTLALKKGSSLIEDYVELENNSIEQMVSYGHKLLQENEYKPYYIYKLKNQNAGLENVGFTRDEVCIFNIDSMEETSSIIACGANAISKRIFFDTNRIERHANCKFANDYIKRIDEMIQKKIELFD